MAERVLLKLGGSVITHKEGQCTVDHGKLESIADAIAACRGGPLVIVHGAGSCGHPEARRYHLEKGLSPEYLAGIYHTHHAVTELNDAVVSVLRTRNIEAVGVPLLGSVTAENGRIHSFETSSLEVMVEQDIVPVLHGDVVMDLQRGACIISGDQLLAHLAIALSITRVGLATDVPGVLDAGRVVPRIDPSTVGSIAIGDSSHTDVTGGMKGKITELLHLASAGIESHIFHVSRIGDFLEGYPHGGTTVSMRSLHG